MGCLVEPNCAYDPAVVPNYKDGYYDSSCTLSEVEAYLKKVKAVIREGNFRIEVPRTEGAELRKASRSKNRDFMRKYGLYRQDAQKDFLLSIDASEFCHRLQNSGGGELYVFCASRELYKAASGFERVLVYVKHDYREQSRPYDVVVSMHELELPIWMPFLD